MREALVIGRPNVGKTLLAVNLAESLGRKRIDVLFRPREGASYTRTYTVSQARAELVDDQPHRTLCLQSMVLDVPRGKSVKKVVLTDSTGLVDDIHPASEVRRAMADTLRHVTQAALILHVVDAASGLDGIDRDILRLGRIHEGYAVVANKMDLPGRAERLPELVRVAAPARVLPVSALERTGFAEVKGFVRKRV